MKSPAMKANQIHSRKKTPVSRETQPELIGLSNRDRKRKFMAFGGSLLSGNPRISRPVSSNNSMHLILKSSLAKGAKAFSHPGRRKQLEALITSQALKQGVKIFELSINSNHIHMLLQPISQRAYKAFIKAISGLIARKILKKERGAAAPSSQCVKSVSGMMDLKQKTIKSDGVSKIRFWDHRPFTRVVAWGKAFFEARFYVIQNHYESIGYIDYRPRQQKVMRI